MSPVQLLILIVAAILVLGLGLALGSRIAANMGYDVRRPAKIAFIVLVVLGLVLGACIFLFTAPATVIR